MQEFLTDDLTIFAVPLYILAVLLEARWARKHPEAAEQLALARDRAAELESGICDLARVRPDEVRREPWAEAAIRRARRERDRAAS